MLRRVCLLVAGIALATACSRRAGAPQPPGASPCTTEAFVCPDGTAVGREGPNCEFPPCPNPEGSAAPALDGTPEDGQSAPPVPSDEN